MQDGTAINGQEVVDRIKSLIESLACELVDKPEKVEVTETSSSAKHAIIFTIRTDPQDIGKVIGKRGNTANAMRSLMESIGAKYRMKVLLEIDNSVRVEQNA